MATSGANIVLLPHMVRMVLCSRPGAVLPSRNLDVFCVNLLKVQLLLLHAARTSTRTRGNRLPTTFAVLTLLTMGTCMLTRTMLGSRRGDRCRNLTVRVLLVVRESMTTPGLPPSTTTKLACVFCTLLISTIPTTLLSVLPTASLPSLGDQRSDCLVTVARFTG